MDLHLRALDRLAHINGWIVERKQVARVTAHMRVNKADLQAAIAQDLDALEPGARAQLQGVAAGTLAAADSVGISAE
jgi:hypothetical protein